MSTNIHKEPSQGDRWATGRSIDGKGEFKFAFAEPHGEEPDLGKAAKETYAQKEQMDGKSSMNKLKEKITGQ